MLLKVNAGELFFKDYGWHSGRFHFAFGDYVDERNEHFGVLCALNDFVVQPQSGFETHPHKEMEIVSYCVRGTLSHRDVMGNFNELRRGDSQYTCTGSGITHSEMNEKDSDTLRFLQIWIKPIQAGLQPTYTEKRRSNNQLNGTLRHLASGDSMEDVMQIAQDANVYAGEIDAGHYLYFENIGGRQSYLYCLEGNAMANEFTLQENDAMKVWGKECVHIRAQEDAHFILVEMARG